VHEPNSLHFVFFVGELMKTNHQKPHIATTLQNHYNTCLTLTKSRTPNDNLLDERAQYALLWVIYFRTLPLYKVTFKFTDNFFRIVTLDGIAVLTALS